MSIFITIRQGEQDFTCKTLHMGEEEQPGKAFLGKGNNFSAMVWFSIIQRLCITLFTIIQR